MAAPIDAVQATLGSLDPAPRCVVVALSGGLDSTVLLHAAVAARDLPGWRGTLQALHVDHSLQPAAAAWAAACRKAATALGVPVDVVAVDARPFRGESPEAAARAARYRAFAARLGHGDVLLTAHHVDDQAETLLLQMMRGAGIAGLAAMPRVAPLGSGRLLRPFLGLARDDLRAWARRREIAWSEDPSNRDLAPDRNYLRHEVLPRLRERWPAATRSIAASAAHCAATLPLLEEAAAADLRAVAGDGEPSWSLPLGPIADWPVARVDRLLRHWLGRLGITVPGRRALAALHRDLLAAGIDRTPVVAWPGGELRRYRDRLHALAASPVAVPDGLPEWLPSAPLKLPGGVLSLHRTSGRGLASKAPLTVRPRAGGERLQPAGGDHSRQLKKLFQEVGVPPWVRPTLPLLYRDGVLVAVPGLWVAAGHAAAPGAPGWLPSWQPVGTGVTAD